MKKLNQENKELSKMSWRDWPYWLKGGIIGLIFSLIIVLVSGIYGGLVLSPTDSYFFRFAKSLPNLFDLVLFPLVFLKLFFCGSWEGILPGWKGLMPSICDLPKYLEFLIELVVLAFIFSVLGFISGALIGFIIGKIKSRKQGVE